ncbi:MAG: hypothetical protein ACUVQP_03745 [Bacteroidales bacterium]
MTRNKQWDNILMKIEECKNDIQYIQNNASDIPMIEIDIALEKLSRIYDKLLSLKLGAASTEETGFFAKNSSLISKIIKDSVFNKTEIEKDEPILTNQIKENNNDEKEISDKPKNEEIEQTLLTDTKQKTIKEENLNQQPSIAQEKQSKNTKTLAETLKKETSSTVADLMASLYKKKDITTLQQLKPIKDLKQAISINDKIMFIKEIFLNDVDKYNSTLTALNSCKNLDEALKIIEQIVVIDSENHAVQQLLELVYRRYL